MSEQLNQELSLSGKIPSGLFNMMFEFSSCWQKDAACTKTLAFDGMFITLYTVALEKSQMVLKDHVRKEVPSSWEPAALARYVVGLPSLNACRNMTMLMQSLLTFKAFVVFMYKDACIPMRLRLKILTNTCLFLVIHNAVFLLEERVERWWFEEM